MNVIAVDAMGGDQAPGPEVSGAVSAARETSIEVILVGDETRLRSELKRHGVTEQDHIRVEHASQVVKMTDHPGHAFRQKPNSSMRKAFDLVANGTAAAVVSAGNSGALLSHGLFVLKRIKGIDRPGIVSVLPTPTGHLVLCDTGANVEVKPRMLAQFGILGALYDRIAHGRKRPRVGLLSNGTESSKGTPLTRAADEMLRAVASQPDAELEYVGYVEGTELFSGGIDVVATDGFTGNVVLKVGEGLAEALYQIVRNQLGDDPSVAAALTALKKTVDYRERGGALLGGVDGIVMICHGRSDALAMKNAIKAADTEVRGGLLAALRQAFERHRPLWDGLASGDAP